MGTYYKPQSPIQSGEDFIYPITTADQIMKSDNSRRLEQAGLIVADNSVSLGGVAAEDYALKTDTAQDSSKLGGVAASEYALKTDTAPDSSKLGGQLPSYYAKAEELGHKANKADVLTLEEIQASTDLTDKIASASSVKSINTRFSSLYSYGINTGSKKNIKLRVSNVGTINIFYFGAFNMSTGYITGYFYKRNNLVNNNDVYKFINGSIKKLTATVSEDNNYITVPMEMSWCVGTLLSNTPLTFEYV